MSHDRHRMLTCRQRTAVIGQRKNPIYLSPRSLKKHHRRPHADHRKARHKRKHRPPTLPLWQSRRKLRPTLVSYQCPSESRYLGVPQVLERNTSCSPLPPPGGGGNYRLANRRIPSRPSRPLRRKKPSVGITGIGSASVGMSCRSEACLNKPSFSAEWPVVTCIILSTVSNSCKKVTSGPGGALLGVTALLESESGPCPASFVALTVKV